MLLKPGVSTASSVFGADSLPITYSNVFSIDTGTNSLGWSNVADTKAQVYTTTSAGRFGRYGLRMWNTGSPTGVLTFELWSFNGTNPVAKLATGSTVDVATLPSADPGSINTYFICPTYNLANATQYCFFVSGSGLTLVNGATDFVNAKRSAASIYSGGSYILTNTGSETASAEDISFRDFNFAIDYED